MTTDQNKRDKFNTIIINHKNGATTTWFADQWDEYTYTDHNFVIIKNGGWVGIYNMDGVDNIVVTSTR